MVEEDPKTGKVLVALTDFEYCQKMSPQAEHAPIEPEQSSYKCDLISLCLMITNVLNGNQLDTKQQPSTKNLQDQFHYI